MDDHITSQIELLVQQMNLSESEPLGYIWEVQRLKSLEKWPLATPCAKEIAEAGFYCSEDQYPDTVKCFSCFIELGGWEPTDKPWEEHLKRASTMIPHCQFVAVGKKESMLTVDDFLDIFKSVILRTSQMKHNTTLLAVLAIHRKKKSALKKDLRKLGLS